MIGVTIIRGYAVEHGESNLGGDYKIISKTVKAKDVFTAGDSWLEWGYSPELKDKTDGTKDLYEGGDSPLRVIESLKPVQMPAKRKRLMRKRRLIKYVRPKDDK